MTRRIIPILILTFITQLGFSQNLNKGKLDSLFNALETNNKFMGSVALSQNGKALYEKQIGYSDTDNKIKPDHNSKYRIGSISKTFTSVLIFKAIEEKKIKLTDKIDQYFPSIKNANIITISSLLNHRSGIHNFTALDGYLKWNTEKKSEAELVEIIAKSGSDFEPESKADYNNSNYVLLSFILQKIYKKDYAQLLNEKITKPAGLKNTYFGKQINIKDNESFSYSFNGNWVKESETDPSIPLGAGALVSTATDLTKFADALFGGKLVSAKSLELMKTIKGKYGMGLIQIPFYDKISYGHTGGIDGFRSVFSYFPADKIAFALVSNGTNYELNNISLALLSAVYNKPYNIPAFKTIEVTSEDLDKYLGVYSSKQMPLKITISKNDKTLMAQATGQSAFPLDASEKDNFKFEQAGVVLEFNPSENTMILKQRGGKFLFAKE